MAFCLLPKLTDKFIEKIKSGELDPQKLAELSSAERRAKFAEFMGEDNAKQVNALFESKLLLKNQETGMINWVRSVTGMKPEIKRDLVSRIAKLDKVLNPADQKVFLEDLASQKIGVGVSLEEIKQISELSKAVENQRAINPNGREYGKAALKLEEYVNSLKPQSKNIITNVANIPKTALSTLDLSAAFRQGWGMISTKAFYQALPKMFQYALSKEAYTNLKADIVADPLYPVIKKSGLRVSTLADKLSQREEAYMTNLLDKVPGVAASERAYVGFLNKLRFERFKTLIRSAELRGEDVRPGSKATKEIANVVNDFTGSGNIGKGDKYAGSVPALNATLFSPRKISATINMFNPQRYLDPRISPTARRAALRQLIGSVAITGGVLALAKMAGSKVTTNPTNSDFGKVVTEGGTRFEVTGGNSTYAVLIARLIKGQSTSSVSGKTTPLNAKDKKGQPAFGAQTKADLGVRFGRNKLSPVASLFVDWLYGADSIGNPFNVTTELKNRITPLIIQDLTHLIKKDPNNAIIGTLGDMFGIGIQNY